MTVVDDILAAYARWGLGPAVGGEWGAIRASHRAPFHDALRREDRAALAEQLVTPMRRDSDLASTDAGAWYGLVSPQLQASDREVWYARLGEDADETQVHYPGDPHAGVYPDAYRHDAEAWRLLGATARILEVGGGYGGLALHLYRSDPDSLHYVDLDLPDTLYLAYAFLREKLPEGVVALGYDPGAAISLVPCDAIPPLDGFEAVVNYRSWGEMEAAELARYFDLIADDWRPDLVVHENASRVAEDPAAPAGMAKYRAGVLARGHEDIPVQDYPPLRGYVLHEQRISPWRFGGRYLMTTLTREESR